MPRRLLALSAVLAGLVLAPSTAGADVGQFLPAEAIDGPNGTVQRLGGLDVARDGTGALTYVKTVGGVDHVFASRLVNGAWQPPEQLDAGLAGPSSQPVVAAADGGRLAIAYVSGGALFTVVHGTAGGFSAPALLAAGATDPAIDLSINNVSYVSFTVGGDVLVARKARDTSQFLLLPTPVDVTLAAPAGQGPGRSRVAVAADGIGIVIWGEAGHVYARRVFDQRLSAAPQDLTLDSLGGFPAAGGADLPDIDMEDDSSFAWAVFRQRFADGGGGTAGRVIARRLVGSQFDPPVVADAMPIPAPAPGGEPRVEIDGRGEGYVASATANGVAVGAVIKDDKLAPGVGLGAGVPGATLPVPAVDEGGDGVIAWQAADNTIRARAYDNVPTSRVPQAPSAPIQWSNPAFGPSDAANGLEAAADRAGDIAVAFVQGTPLNRIIMVSSFDRAPGAFRLTSGTSFRNAAATPLKWSQSFELWGPLTYRVEVDGKAVGSTNATALAVPGLTDGVHRWRVVATDRRGQVTATPTRVLRQDGTPPRARVTVSGTRRRGRPIRVVVRPTDASRAGRPASGVGRVTVAWGDGSFSTGRRTTHSYRRSGRRTVRVTVRDRAGNAVVVSRAITIR